MSDQLPLPLGHRVALGRDDLLVSACNAEAVRWIDAWPDWPEGVRGLALHGPPASGKSHLAEAWRHKTGAGLVNAGQIATLDIPGQLTISPHLVVDDLDALEDGEALLHLINASAESGGKVMTLSRQPPARLDFSPRDLTSRLRAFAAVAIGAPDDALIVGVMAKMFHDRQLSVDRAVLDYLSTRMQRSFAAARDLVSRLDAVSLAEGRRITLPVARRVLGEIDTNTTGLRGED